MSLIINALKPKLIEYIEAGRAGLPAAVTSLITTINTWLPTSVDKATAAFRNTYTDVTVRISKTLPARQVQLVTVGGKALDWIKVKAQKL